MLSQTAGKRKQRGGERGGGEEEREREGQREREKERERQRGSVHSDRLPVVGSGNNPHSEGRRRTKRGKFDKERDRERERERERGRRGAEEEPAQRGAAAAV